MSTILCLPRSFSATVTKATKLNQQTINANNFTTITFTEINTDPGSNFNLTTGFYKVPSDGLYQITATLRTRDNSNAGIQYGMGVHTSNNDGPWFLWHAVQTTINAGRRTTYPYIRTDFFTANQNLRLYTFSDQGYIADVAVMNIFRIA